MITKKFEKYVILKCHRNRVQDNNFFFSYIYDYTLLMLISSALFRENNFLLSLYFRKNPLQEFSNFEYNSLIKKKVFKLPQHTILERKWFVTFLTKFLIENYYFEKVVWKNISQKYLNNNFLLNHSWGFLGILNVKPVYSTT